MLIYVNELAPVREDLIGLKSAMASSEADVVPANGSQDAYRLSTWRPGDAIPDFSLTFRLARAIRVIPVNVNSQNAAAGNFDSVGMGYQEPDHECSTERKTTVAA